MSGFSAEWLSLREAADLRARDTGLLHQLATYLAGQAEPRIIDIGCGTGSNLRALAPALGPRQHWTLVDYDAELLEQAVDALSHWAGQAIRDDAGLVLSRKTQTITVGFRQADLAQDLAAALAGPADLITASAFFDLVSRDLIEAVSDAVTQRSAAFYTVLTYNGQMSWSPADPLDDAVTHAFNQHQLGDKGLGAASGPAAPERLAAAFRHRGYDVSEADSPWRLDERDMALIDTHGHGVARAVAETGAVDAGRLTAWEERGWTGALVGHTDTLALPPG